MRGLYTGLGLWNLLVLAVTATTGALAGEGLPISRETHRVLGLFAAVFCCLVHSILITHFIGSMKWLQQTGPTAGLDDTKTLRTAWIKGRAFPMVIAAMLAAVGAATLGGRAGSGTLGLVAHAVAALAAFPLNLYAMLWGREAVAANTVRLRDVERLALARQERGLILEADVASLRPESGRAGGKTLVFLSANVWVLWFYRRHVLRVREEPLWPYALASTLLLLVGLALLRRWRADDAPPPTPS